MKLSNSLMFSHMLLLYRRTPDARPYVLGVAFNFGVEVETAEKFMTDFQFAQDA